MITATHDGSGGVRLHDDAGAFARVKPADRHRLRRALAADGCTRAVLMPSGVITVTERHGSEVKLLTRDGKPRTGDGSDRRPGRFRFRCGRLTARTGAGRPGCERAPASGAFPRHRPRPRPRRPFRESARLPGAPDRARPGADSRTGGPHPAASVRVRPRAFGRQTLCRDFGDGVGASRENARKH